MHNIICDENIPLSVKHFLSGLGYQVTHVGQESFGIKDEEIFEKLFTLQATLITLDKDFGKLSFYTTLEKKQQISS